MNGAVSLPWWPRHYGHACRQQIVAGEFQVGMATAKQFDVLKVRELDRLSRSLAKQLIFEEELNGWHRLKSDWPPHRDLDTFLDWFEVQIHSMVLDLHQGRLKTERY